MLADPRGNGSCIAWAQLLYQTLEAEGITGAKIFEICVSTVSSDTATALPIGFMVKNWNFGKHIRSGPDGLNASTRGGDYVNAFPKGNGMPNQPCVGLGTGGVLHTSPAGDDLISGNEILAGRDGICNSAAVGGDVQIIALGKGAPNTPGITPGANGILESTVGGDDTVQDGLFAGTTYPYLLFTGTSIFWPVR